MEKHFSSQINKLIIYMTKKLVCHHFFVAKVFSQCVTSNRCFDQHNALQHLSILSFSKK